MGVVAIHLLERRVLTQRTVDHVRLRQIRVLGEEDVRLDRGVRRLGQLVFVETAEDRLAAHHDDVIVVGNIRGRAQNVRQLLALHEARGVRCV